MINKTRIPGNNYNGDTWFAGLPKGDFGLVLSGWIMSVLVKFVTQHHMILLFAGFVINTNHWDWFY